MMLNQTTRPTPHALCPRGELPKNKSILVIPHVPSRLGSSEGALRALLETWRTLACPRTSLCANINRKRVRWSAFYC
jgi:hypothetical protein